MGVVTAFLSLRRPKPNARVHTPEIRPPHGSYGIVMSRQRSKIGCRLNPDPCTNAMWRV